MKTIISTSEYATPVDNGGEAEIDFATVLASSVHDMKNSLGMLLTTLEEVIGEIAPENRAQLQQFAVLEYEASRINSELVQLLCVYRMQKKTLPVLIDEHYPSDMLEEQIQRNAMLFRTRNIEVAVDCDENAGWCFDAELVAGIVNNVLVNAARYTEDKLLVRVAEIEHNGASWWQLEIHDNGSGYPEFMLSSCAVQKGIDLKTYSTRLGLYFAAAAAQLHSSQGRKGYIELSNGGEYGGGVFKLVLP